MTFQFSPKQLSASAYRLLDLGDVTRFAMFLIGAKAVYLLLEYFFNLNLLGLLLTPQPSEGAVSAIELKGRTLAAVGMTLLVATAIINNKAWVSKTILGSSGKNVAITLLITFFTAFYIQKVVIDNFVENASSEQRFEALHLHFLRHTALAEEQSTDDTFFMVAMGAIGLTPLDRQEVARKMASRPVDLSVDDTGQSALVRNSEVWDLYEDMTGAINGYWDDYQDLSSRFEGHETKALQMAADAFPALQEQLSERYRAYKQQSDAFDAKVASRLAPASLAELHKHLSQIHAGDMDAAPYNQVMDSYFPGASKTPAVNAWCKDEACPAPVSEMKRLVTDVLQTEFNAISGGVPSGLTYAQYVSQDAIRLRVLDELGLGYKGCASQAGSLDNQDDFAEFVTKSAWVGMLAKKIKTKQCPGAVVSGLDRQGFIKSLLASNAFPDLIGLIDLPKEVDDDFFQQRFKPTYMQNIKDTGTGVFLPSHVNSYNDSPLAAFSESAVRIVYVSTICLFLSAMFIVANTLTLAYPFIGRFTSKTVQPVTFYGGSYLALLVFGWLVLLSGDTLVSQSLAIGLESCVGLQKLAFYLLIGIEALLV